MSMVAKVVSMMEKILGRQADDLAQKQAVIQRKRKFRGKSLLRMIVLTLLKKPDANFQDRALTAAQLGVPVSATAVEKRFTQPLVDFLKEVVSVALQQLLIAVRVPEEVTNRRRQKAREKATKHGREPSAEDLECWAGRWS